MSSDFTVVIPARYASSRLPGKVLLDLAGQTLLQRVIQAAKKTGADRVIVAVDDERVEKEALKYDVDVCMTSDLHQSGVERCSEVIEAYDIEDDDNIIIWQADEPFITPKSVKELVLAMQDHDTVKIGTLASKISDPSDLVNPNIVKIVLNKRQCASYFSRAPIPWDRECGVDMSQIKLSDSSLYYHHIGIYYYKAKAILNYLDWSASPLEEIEKLEQLRIIYHAAKIYVHITAPVESGIDTQDDLYRAQEKLTKNND